MKILPFLPLLLLPLALPGCFEDRTPGSCTLDSQCPSPMVCVYGCDTCYVECFGGRGTTCFGRCARPLPEYGTCYENADCATGLECTVTPAANMSGHCIPAPCGGCTPPLVCRDGRCACPVGELECDGACYCGACGTTCASGWFCQDNACELACQDPFVGCDGQCVDPLIDKNHCGTCGNVCEAGVPCTEGECTAP